MKQLSFPAWWPMTLLGVAAACGSSSPAGTGGHTGASTSSHASTGSGTGGSASSTGASSGTGEGGGCQGDGATWAMLTKGPIACVHASDCCVILNDCTNEAQIVSAAEETAAKAAWPYCDSQCTHCIPPAVEVGCQNGVCVGEAVVDPDGGTDLLTDHCGTGVPFGGSPEELHFTCGG
jgi:hypothetical protein